MSSNPLHITSIGMLTPIGSNLAMTAASVKAGISGYQEDDYFIDHRGDAVSVARLPDNVFDEETFELDYGTYYDPRIDRLTQISIYCINQCLNAAGQQEPIPVVFAQPIQPEDFNPKQWLKNINRNTGDRILKEHSTIKSGDRASVASCLQYAAELLNSGYTDVLIGGADCLLHQPIVRYYDDQERLKTGKSMTGFTIGEGGCFMLLSRTKKTDSGFSNVSLNNVRCAEESGHLHSDKPYLGEGLTTAWTNTLSDSAEKSIGCIYSSMNGEPFWSKELGVAMIRNKRFLLEDCAVEHPADCYGDLGSASGFTLLAIAAHLQAKEKRAASLVSLSSDFELRGSVTLHQTYS